MISGNDFVRMMYEGDGIVKPHKIKPGGETEVETNPETSPPNSNDTRPFTRDPSTTTGDNAQEKIDFPQQRGPTNPQRHLADIWNKSIEQTTRRAQQRQTGRYTNRDQ
jgi:hypothetical protein